MIRVLVVSEQQLMASLIASVLGDEPDIEVIGRATSVQVALEKAAQADVLLVSTRLPDDGALELNGQDLTNHEIAERLVIEVGTVKNHVHSILDKLNVSSRRDAASYLLLAQDEKPDEPTMS